MLNSLVISLTLLQEFVKMMTKKQPKTLYRADPRESVLQNDIVIRISVTSAIIFALLVFILICFLLVPKTYGFFMW